MIASKVQRRTENALCVMLLSVLIIFPGPKVNATDISEAETTLWLTDQLRSVTVPSVFTYQFERSGTYEGDFTDTVRFLVSSINSDGMKSASVEFFTGARRVEVAPVESTNINPILKIYLQGDVYEMNRLTDVERKSKERWRYFQRKIKLALAESANVESLTITYENKSYAAREISFQPFIDDVHLSNPGSVDSQTRLLYQGLVNKTYRVIVCEELPAYLYRIETVVPESQDDREPLIREVLQLVSAGEI